MLLLLQCMAMKRPAVPVRAMVGPGQQFACRETGVYRVRNVAKASRQSALHYPQLDSCTVCRSRAWREYGLAGFTSIVEQRTEALSLFPRQ
jgi:hypothetical protein